MRKGLSITGGIIGAIFSGGSVWAFTAKHFETVIVMGFPLEREVTGYPELGALFLAFAIIGFVIMVVGFLSKEESERSPQPVVPSTGYACPHCGQPIAKGTPVCPNCARQIKW